MTGFRQVGLGDTSAPDLSFLSGGLLVAFAVGLGLIVLFKGGFATAGEPRRRSGARERKEYAAYVSKLHGLSAKDRRWLEEHGD